MRIESGPNTERIVRNSLFFALVAVFAILFIRDGYGGYQKKNFEEHIQSLDTADREKAQNARVYDNVTLNNARLLSDQASNALSKISLAAQRKALEVSMGGPPSFETADALYYFGPDYRIKFSIKGTRLSDPVGTPSPHKMTDIRFQRWIGWALCAVAIISLLQVLRVLTTHCVLDDAGLAYRFKGSITWDQIKDLESSLFTKKGWVDLVYAGPSGESRMRLDEYHLKRFADIIAEICRRKGFDDPVVAEMRLKSQRAESA